ncbi:Tyrosine recombinase XerC [Dirofilaria immitis]
MLGLVNLPSESVDFYAQPKNDHNNLTIFGQYKKKLAISYTDDGRRVIDGKVENKKEPQEMWCNLLINLLIKNVFDGNIRNIHKQPMNDSTEFPSMNDDIMMKSQITSYSKLSILTALANVNSKNTIFVKKKPNIMDKIILLMKKQIWWRK